MANQETAFENKCEILAELWTEYRNDVEFADLMEYSDLGFPLAYSFAYKIVEPTDRAKRYVEEVFALFLEVLGIQDNGYENLTDIFLFTDTMLEEEDKGE